MSKFGKQVLKNQAKKIYEENARKVPKRNRITFSQFFKQYTAAQKKEQNPVVTESQQPQEALPDALEDFNFDEMVNVSKIDENSLEVVEVKASENIEEKK
jgi:hypothetical protein